MSVAWDAIRKPLWRTQTPPGTVEMTCRTLKFPLYLVDEVLGALSLLSRASMWEKDGSDEIIETVAIMADVFDSTERRCNMIGQVVMHTKNTLPDNWLRCNGNSYLRVDYPELYAAMNANYYIDADNFRVPDFGLKFPMGNAGPVSPGDQGGQDRVTLSTAEMPIHNHSSKQYTTNIDVEGPGIPDPLAIGLPILPDVTGNAGGGQSHENLPPYEVINFAIVAS